MSQVKAEAEAVMHHNVRLASIKDKIGQIIEDVADARPGEDEDIMSFGLDSLSTVAVVSGIVRTFKGVSFSPSFMFDYPSISKIAELVAEAHISDKELVQDLIVMSDKVAVPDKPAPSAAFTQLVGAEGLPPAGSAVYQPGSKARRFHRSTDGMECVQIPGATVWVGDGLPGREALPNEKPCHHVELAGFLIDIEPVSVGAFARFLNIEQPPTDVLRDWYLLRPGDVREKHLPLQQQVDGSWCVQPDIPPTWPMIMVSWYGANAYALWANGEDWKSYKLPSPFLPTEAQWEYAARGRHPTTFPWGDTPPSPALLNVFWEGISAPLDPETPLNEFPLVSVNMELGVSPFGLRGMAGNVWQWCRDVYDQQYYSSKDASRPNAWNKDSKGPRAERGGSWVGGPHLARCSYRRGRVAGAKGRCLGFRCVGPVPIRLRSNASTAAPSSNEAASTEASASSEVASTDGEGHGLP
mmetsp:Transcript_4449/g.10418  ORF Transcript_4449/g.10418 Transcript_4449/m.10418 type:complete len:468 (+) Transcript_4449:52-1455(+)